MFCLIRRTLLAPNSPTKRDPKLDKESGEYKEMWDYLVNEIHFSDGGLDGLVVLNVVLLLLLLFHRTNLILLCI